MMMMMFKWTSRPMRCVLVTNVPREVCVLQTGIHLSSRVLLDYNSVYFCGKIPTFLKPEDGGSTNLLKRRYPITTLRGVTTQKNSIWIFTFMKTPDLTPGIRHPTLAHVRWCHLLLGKLLPFQNGFYHSKSSVQNMASAWLVIPMDATV
jgi:hypothetical protein